MGYDLTLPPVDADSPVGANGIVLTSIEPRVRARLIAGYRELLAVAIEIKNDAERAYCLLRLAELGVTEP